MQQTGQKQGETGNFGLQKGELPKLLRIIFSWEDGRPRVREAYRCWWSKATIKHKRKLIMITGKEADHLHWQLGGNIVCILVLKRYVGQAVDQKGSQSGPRP